MSSKQLAKEKQNCHKQDSHEEHNHRKENVNSNDDNDNQNKDNDGESQLHQQRSDHIKINQPMKTTTKETTESCCTFESRGCVSGSTDSIPNVTVDDINYVVDVLRIHAELEASTVIRQQQTPTIKIIPGRLELRIDNKESSGSMNSEIGMDDYIDIYDSNNMGNDDSNNDKQQNDISQLNNVEDASTDVFEYS